MGRPGEDPASPLESDDRPALLQVFLAVLKSISFGGVQINRDRAYPGDIRRDVAHKKILEGLKRGVNDQAKILEMPPEVLADQEVKLFFGEDHPVRREKNRPGDNLEDSGHILEASAMVAHDDVRALSDKIVVVPDFDFLPQQGKSRHPADDGLKTMELFLEASQHHFVSILSNKKKNSKKEGSGNL
jgi:hypothetical protein